MLPDSAAIEPLLAERDAVHGWLRRLDEAGNATPEAVRAKVRSDYELRLDGITDRLRDHADTITSRLAEDRAEHAELMAQLATANTGLAEAQLRHAVGEFDSQRFDEEQRRFGEAITEYRQGIDAALERIERMESVHALIMQPVIAVEALAPAPVEMPRVTPTLVDVAPSPKPVEEDRFDDALLSVFDEPAGREEQSGHSPLSFRPRSGVAQEVARPSEPRRFTPAADAPRLGLPQEALPSFSRQPAEPAPAPAPAVISEPSGNAPAAPSRSSDDALFGGDAIVAVGSEVAQPVSRTLRCGECGAMNRPLEWYCEKCGAELTAA